MTLNSSSSLRSSSLVVVSILLVLVLLLQNIPPVVGIIDCGCPETCTSTALSNDQDESGRFTCQGRIEFLMTKYGDSELKACEAASKDPSTLSIEDNAKRPCRYESCHPEGCKKKKTPKKPYSGAIHNCGCPDTCPQEAGETNGSKFECQGRISYLMEKYGDSELTACKGATTDPSLSADENSKRPCRYEACHPEACKKDGKNNQETTKKEEEKATPVVAKAATTTTQQQKSASSSSSSSSVTPPKEKDQATSNNDSSSSSSSFHRVIVYVRIVGMLALLNWWCRSFRNKNYPKGKYWRRNNNNNRNNNSSGILTKLTNNSTSPSKPQRVSKGGGGGGGTTRRRK